jgi:site-specific recombinase XerD
VYTKILTRSVIQQCGNLQHDIMLKLLFFTAVRVSELVRPFTTRRVQQIVKQYRDEAGIAQHVHPRLFRHQMITYLTARELSDSQIQLISGHESKKSLEVYQHLSLKNVEQAYQEAVKTLEV